MTCIYPNCISLVVVFIHFSIEIPRKEQDEMYDKKICAYFTRSCLQLIWYRWIHFLPFQSLSLNNRDVLISLNYTGIDWLHRLYLMSIYAETFKMNHESWFITSSIVPAQINCDVLIYYGLSEAVSWEYFQVKPCNSLPIAISQSLKLKPNPIRSRTVGILVTYILGFSGSRSLGTPLTKVFS